MKQKFGPILIATILFLVFLFAPISWFYPLISDKKVDNAAASLRPIMFQGVALQEKMWQSDKYLPMYGSSELSRFDEFHPYNYFKMTDPSIAPFLIGRGGMQSIIHYLNLASMSTELKDKKMVFIISPQWFQPKGIDDAHFAPNFSNLQAYRFVFNKDIPNKQKKYIAKRLLSFQIVQQDKILTNMLEGMSKKADTGDKIKMYATKPLAYTYMKVLERKDLVQSIFQIQPKEIKHANKDVADLSFDQLKHKAEKKGRMEASNNEFHVLNTYYNKKLHPKLGELRNYNTNGSYFKSPEYKDLQQILDFLKANKMKALFVSIPVNGYWYDYTGFAKDERTRYYQKINKKIVQNGFELVDYAGHEYDKYFLRDTIHIGWKGWTYIDEDIKKFCQTN
ncbi:MAG: D-alanyl-lipoteichoic acid biosynthesis protein DltD [Bacillaceae bacterium]